jgi:hypothetical protein
MNADGTYNNKQVIIANKNDAKEDETAQETL